MDCEEGARCSAVLKIKNKGNLPQETGEGLLEGLPKLGPSSHAGTHSAACNTSGSSKYSEAS